MLFSTQLFSTAHLPLLQCLATIEYKAALADPEPKRGCGQSPQTHLTHAYFAARAEDRDGDGAAVAAALRITPLRLRAFTLAESLDLAVPTNSPEFVGKTPSGWERGGRGGTAPG